MRGLEIQLRTRSKIRDTAQGQALNFGFSLGPIQFFIIANLPEKIANNDGTFTYVDSGEGPLVYVKINLKVDDGWQLFREH